jgi:hypothetical protein
MGMTDGREKSESGTTVVDGARTQVALDDKYRRDGGWLLGCARLDAQCCASGRAPVSQSVGRRAASGERRVRHDDHIDDVT